MSPGIEDDAIQHSLAVAGCSFASCAVFIYRRVASRELGTARRARRVRPPGRVGRSLMAE